MSDLKARLRRGGTIHSEDDNAAMAEAADRIEALEEAQTWRPIETAPRDGQRFLTWCKFYGVRIGRAYVRADHDDWLSNVDAYGGSSKGGMRATHWMPLPTPPSETRHEP